MPKKNTPSAEQAPQWVSTLTLKTHYFDLKDDFLSSQIKNGSLKLGKHYLPQLILHLRPIRELLRSNNVPNKSDPVSHTPPGLDQPQWMMTQP